MAEAIKDQRAQVKKKLTSSLRKLNSALQLGATSDIVAKEANDVEDHFSKLNDVHMDYEEITDTVDENYLQEITEKYNHSMRLYYNSIKEEKEIKIKRELAPLLASIERGFTKIEAGIENLNKVDASDLDIHVVIVDKESLERNTQELLDNIQKVSLSLETKDIGQRADTLLVRVDSVLRKCEILLKRAKDEGTRKPEQNNEKKPQEASGKDIENNSIGSAQEDKLSKEDPVKGENVSTVSEGSSTKVEEIESKYNLADDKEGVIDYIEPETQALETPTQGDTRSTPSIKDDAYNSESFSGSSASMHQIKRIELPDFYGDRKQWPEFKAMFRHLAEASIHSQQALAYELKRHVKAPADVLIQSVYSTRPGAYDRMWKKLGEVYDDPGASVSAALSTLHSLRRPAEDFRSLVSFINEIEAVHAQLEELNQLHCVSVRDVDALNSMLPMAVKMEWNRGYSNLDPVEKLQPFQRYMDFLERERAAMIRTSEHNPLHRTKRTTMIGTSEQTFQCYVHKSSGHSTLSCRAFCKMSVQEKFDFCRKEKLCFRCLTKHKRDECMEGPCTHCGKSHNSIMCPRSPLTDSTESPQTRQEFQNEQSMQATGFTYTCASKTAPLAVLPIAKTQVRADIRSPALTLFDSGSDASYITFQFADKIGIKPLRKLKLNVTTMGNVATSIPTSVFKVPLVSTEGNIVWIEAFGIREITGHVSRLDEQAINQLFPGHDPTLLQRHKSQVDILLGCDNFGLHPKKELARAGDNLSIMTGRLGLCLQGSHQRLKEETQLSNFLVRTIHSEDIQAHSYLTKGTTHQLFTNQATHTCPKTDSFIQGEELGTTVEPKCGSCRCGKCPLPGHTYSFVEQQELQMIRDGLHYDEVEKRWITKYPWLVSPDILPQNYSAAKSRLVKLEKSLSKDPKWADSYQTQMQDMVDRGVSRKLSPKEIEDWTGPSFYISHLAVTNPKSTSTPIRIVFNSSQSHNGISLNNCLAKGPDSYSNSIIGLLIRWRENKVAMVADIKKMFHSIYLQDLETHCHRYLWRDMDPNKNPDVYVIQRVNMGDRPASAIATEALKLTAELQKKEYPEAAELIIHSSYMDDLVDSVENSPAASKLAGQVDAVLSQGGFRIKCWQFSSQDSAHDSTGQVAAAGLLKCASEGETAVLGVNWIPEEDLIVIHTTIDFSFNSSGAYDKPSLELMKLSQLVPQDLSRRMVLQKVMSLYDPLGIISPFLLKAKILLRKTWELKLGWDDALPCDIRISWVQFFEQLCKVEGMKFDRALTPKEATGSPWLIIFSDGGNLAYGFAAYIRWKLKNGNYWCRLIMAKSRIAPLHKTTTPRMELNGAVLSKRARQVIESEMRLKFEKVIHLVDSLTVHCMLHKTSTRFQIYEGSRIGEIQAATAGDMSEWAWLPGSSNVADHVTRGLNPDELSQNSIWWTGPPMLYLDYDRWGIKLGAQENEKLPGERTCLVSKVEFTKEFPFQYKRFSKIEKLKSVMARILGIAQDKTFRGGRTENLTPKLYQQAELLIIKEAQADIKDLKQYKNLNPKCNAEGIVVVGTRLSRYNPMTLDGKEQALLPTQHHLTKMLMIEAHQQGHLGRDGTVAKFRHQYWTPHADKLAKSVKMSCQECRQRQPQLSQQCMGLLPEARLKASPPFNFTMLDLLGPFLTRGEVNKRTSGKCYMVLFTDLGSRAIHLECVFGYSTEHFLLALSRFVHIRGWPAEIYSDPGSQLLGAERELREAWSQIEVKQLVKKGAQSGTKWIFGPADSPWHQGAAESLIKTVKKCLQYAVHSQRLTAAEYLTTSYEIANLVNERPIGTRPALDSSINILTPNSLLLGRSSAKNPGLYLPDSGNLKTRFQLVRSISDSFWNRWSELYAPSLIKQSKWTRPGRNFLPGDIVLILDKGFKGGYSLAEVIKTFPGADGMVRKVNLRYKAYKPGEPITRYNGSTDILVSRAVQKLALIVSKEERDHNNHC